MSFDAWLAFCAMETVLCFVPGPAVLFVVSVALARGARPGMAAAFGILTTNAAYFALSGTGVAAVLLASSRLFTALKWAGAAYLVWVGLQMLFARGHAVGAPEPRPVSNAFARALVVQGANPKALVFFVALLPQFVDPHAPVGLQILILGVSSTLIEVCVLALYVVFAVQARRLAGARVAPVLERVGGGFLVAAGARLAALKQG
jgi:homoserine/homoserine lactone efflux protein